MKPSTPVFLSVEQISVALYRYLEIWLMIKAPSNTSSIAGESSGGEEEEEHSATPGGEGDGSRLADSDGSNTETSSLRRSSSMLETPDAAGMVKALEEATVTLSRAEGNCRYHLLSTSQLHDVVSVAHRKLVVVGSHLPSVVRAAVCANEVREIGITAVVCRRYRYH